MNYIVILRVGLCFYKVIEVLWIIYAEVKFMTFEWLKNDFVMHC